MLKRLAPRLKAPPIVEVGQVALRDKFLALNAAVNDIFFEMLDPNEWKRFGGTVQ